MSGTVTVVLSEEERRTVLVALRQYRRFHTRGMEVRCTALNVIDRLESAPVEYPHNPAGTILEGSGV